MHPHPHAGCLVKNRVADVILGDRAPLDRQLFTLPMQTRYGVPLPYVSGISLTRAYSVNKTTFGPLCIPHGDMACSTMKAMSPRITVHLTTEEYTRLTALSTNRDVRIRRYAKVILLRAEGKWYQEIAHVINKDEKRPITNKTISRYLFEYAANHNWLPVAPPGRPKGAQTDSNEEVARQTARLSPDEVGEAGGQWTGKYWTVDRLQSYLRMVRDIDMGRTSLYDLIKDMPDARIRHRRRGRD